MTDEHELFLMIDDEGGYSVAANRDDLDPGNHESGQTFRVIRLLVTTERPTEQTARVTIPAAKEGDVVCEVG
jgi:hypothetical protein